MAGIKLPQPRPNEATEGPQAIGEAAAMAAGADLSSRESLNKFNILLRNDRVDDHVHRIVVCGIYLISICLAGLFVTWIWHVGSPARMHFLDVKELDGLKGFLVSGGIGAGITGIWKRFLRLEAPKPPT